MFFSLLLAVPVAKVAGAKPGLECSGCEMRLSHQSGGQGCAYRRRGSASGSTNGKPTPVCLKGQGLDSQNKAHLLTWVGFAAAQCAERRVDQWSEQFARPAMDQLGLWTCGRLSVAPPCRGCDDPDLQYTNAYRALESTTESCNRYVCILSPSES